MPRTSRPKGLAVPARLAALLAVVLFASGLTAMPAGAYREDLGEITRKSRVLKHGCHTYRYHFRVTPPPGDWAMETFVIHRRSGKSVASGGIIGGADPMSGHKTFRLCRPSTKPGRYKITGKLSVMDGFEYQEWWVKPARFRFYRKR